MVEARVYSGTMKSPLTLRWNSASRYHTAMLTPDLFGGWVLVTTSGSHGKGAGRVRQQPLEDYQQGVEAIRRLRHRRRLEGCDFTEAGFTPLPQLDPHDTDLRGAESDALARLFLSWNATEAEQAALLGLSARQLAELKDGIPLPESPETLTRAGHLLAINKSLRLRFGADVEAARTWLRLERKELGGRTPLTAMLESLADLALIRRHLARESDLARGCPRIRS